MGMLDRFRSTKPVTAAAVKVLEPTTLQNGMTQSREAGEAWLAYRLLGEVGYVTNQQARLVGRLDWTVTIGGGDPMDTDASDELLRAAFGDNVEDLATRAALCLQVPGGYVLARTRAGDPDSWRVYSNPLSAKNKKRVEGSDVAVEIRIEDPEDESRNDSPVLRSMDTCRELILARAQSRAQSRNRTAQLGMVLIPDEGVKGDKDQFLADMQDVITAPLSDEMTSSSVTPNLALFPADYIDKWQKFDFSGDYDDKLDEKITRLVGSLGVQLDAPPEILTGFGDVNHWSQWGISEDNWLGHIQPTAKPIGRGFAAALMAAAGAVEVAITPDPGPLLQRRPTTADALGAQAAGLVSDEWTREQLGADETDAPEVAQQDPAVEQAFKMVTAAPSLAQDPGLDVLVDQIRAVMSGTSIPSPTPVASERTDAPASAEPAAIAAALRGRIHRALEVAPEPLTAAATPFDPRALSAIDTQAYDAIEDLVNDTTDRTLERLGAKVRTMGAQGGIPLPKDVPNSDLAVQFEGDIPNSAQTIADTIAGTGVKVDRIVHRAFSRTRSAGVAVTVDPDDMENARALYASLVADAVALRLSERPSVAAAWQAARRIVAVAGGNADTAPVAASFPVAAAAGLPVTGAGIALGRRSLEVIQQVYNLVPGSWIWLHEYRGKDPHPEHQALDGRSFNGEYILEDGINWFPGDHAGCACGSIPDFKEAS